MGGNCENPTVRGFGYNNLKVVVAGSAAVRASAHGNVSLSSDNEEICALPLQRRPKPKKL